MGKHQVSLIPCEPDSSTEDVEKKVTELIGALPQVVDRLRSARKILIKINLAPGSIDYYRERPFQFTDPQVFNACVAFIRDVSDAEIIAGDGTDGMGPAEAIEKEGHKRVIEKRGIRFVDLNIGSFERFEVPRPSIFNWYNLSAELLGVDFVMSIAKMKSHHMCGVTLSIKNLFGIPPNTIYGTPRLTLHSPLRLPLILPDLMQLFPPDISVIDGIVGANYRADA